MTIRITFDGKYNSVISLSSEKQKYQYDTAMFKIVYELNNKKGVTRVPRLQNLVQTDRQTNEQTDKQTADNNCEQR